MELKTMMQIYKMYCRELKNNGLPNKELNNYENFSDIFTKSDFDMVLTEKNRRKLKRYRTKTKIYKMLKLWQAPQFKDGAIVFGTATLDGHALDLKQDTINKTLNKWLKSHFYCAIVNTDYGKKTERLHFHFLAITREKIKQVTRKNGNPVRSKGGSIIYNLERQDYRLGFEPDLLLLDLQEYPMEQVVNYLLKFNNHSNKETTKNRVRFIKSEDYILGEKITKLATKKVKF